MTLESAGREQEWHALKVEDVLFHLEVRENGLTSDDANKRLEHYGPNQLKEAPRPTFLHML